MDLLETKISELTAAQRAELYKTIGTTAVPYPGVKAILDSEGNIARMEMGIIADDTHPLGLYGTQSQEFVTGLMLRNMATPSMLFAQQKLIELMRPESRNRLAVVLGDPGNGKTELANTLAWATDPRGPIKIDCGGRYMSDLLWEQVIDYGQGFKTALTDRISNGMLSANSIKIFEESLPGALVKDGDKITGIDWDKIGEPKEKESTAEAAERGMKLIKQIAELEGIPTQATNSIGIKKQHGVLIRAFQEGRKVILDEFTKSVIGSDDSLQTFIQFCNGEIDKCTVENSTKIAGHPETDDFTFRREDMKVGFLVVATGNEDSDGYSTHSLSGSQNSRLTILKTVGQTFDDWKQRISRELTGLPLTTISWMLSGSAESNPEEFGNAMVQLRQMVPEQERAKIPQEQLTRLKNWDKTNAAVDMLAEFYMFCKQIVDQDSDLNTKQLKTDDPDEAIAAKAKADEAIVDKDRQGIRKEIDAAFRDECAFDLRKIIQDDAAASTIKPAVKSVGEAAGLSLNLAAVGHQNLTPPVDSPEEISADYGTRMEQTLMARIGTMMAGKPTLNAAIVEKMKQIGILPSDGRTDPTLAELLNQDLIPNLGSTRNAYYFRKMLVEHLKGANSDLTDDEVVSQDQAADAYKELETLTAGSAEKSPREASIILLGPDLKQVFNQASAVDSIGNKNQPAPADLIPAADFIESLKVPALAEWNTQAIFRKTVSAEGLIPPSDITTPVVQMAEGNDSIGVTTLRMQGANGDAVPVNIIRDGERGQSLIVTDAVDTGTKDALRRDGYTVVAYGSADAEMRVADFIRATLELPSRKASLTDTERHLTAAFLLRAGDAKNEAELQPLKELMTTKNLPAPAAVNMLNKPL